MKTNLIIIKIKERIKKIFWKKKQEQKRKYGRNYCSSFQNKYKEKKEKSF